MKKNFQEEVIKQILLTIMFGVVLSASQSLSSTYQSTANLSSPKEENLLLRPIVIPNLTGFSENFFTSPPKLHFDSGANGKTPEASHVRQSEVTDRKRESSQETLVRVPLAKRTLKPEENTSKFSARYSLKPEVYGAIAQSTKEGIHTRDIKEEKEIKDKEENEKATESLEIASLLERVENESDILPENTLYPGNSENSPFSHLERNKNEQEETSETYDYSGTKDAEKEEETIPTTSEPNLESRNSPDPWNNLYTDEEKHENHEPSSEPVQSDQIESEENETEEKRETHDEDGNSKRKNYHSVQTPLHKIKFMGPHDSKDSSEDSRMGTRPLSPIGRDHVKYEWPYFKTQVKAEPETFNEITDNESEHDNEKESDDWRKEKTPENSKVSELDKAVEKDEARFGNIANSKSKYNYIGEKNRHLEKQKALIAEEEKDQERPLFKVLNYISEEQSDVNFGDKTAPKTKQQEKGVWSSRQPSTEHSSKLLKDDSKPHKTVSTNFNISKELEPNFQGLEILSAAIFNKNFEAKVPKNRERSRELTKNIFIQELEKKEKIDQKNLDQRKINIFTGSSEIPSKSTFNHLEESDEMYNQILANIQSVFGLRTQPLKSSVGRKRNENPEVNLDENRSLTWSTSVLRKTKSDKNVPESFENKETTAFTKADDAQNVPQART